MSYMRILHVLPIAATCIFFLTDMKTAQDNNSARPLALLEQEWIKTFQSGNSGLLANVLAEDFIYTSGATSLSKEEFIASVGQHNLSKARIELTESRVRVYGTAAVSTGCAVLWPQDNSQVKGEPKVASGSAVVNLSELAEQQKPPPVEPRGVPAPMPVPQGRPVPVADAKYRYTPMYVKLGGRWQMVALHLSQAMRE